MILADGTILQSFLDTFEDPDITQGRNGLGLGVVTRVYLCDDSQNNTSAQSANITARKEANEQTGLPGSRVECDIQVLMGPDLSNDVVERAVILQRKTGFDNFSEEYPNPTSSGLLSRFESGSEEISPYDLDGDWVFFSFLGGRTQTPVVLGWYSHPANTRDSARSKRRIPGSSKTKSDGQRLFRRHQGTTQEIDDKGNVTLSTEEANCFLDHTLERVFKDAGGDLNIKIKDSRALKVSLGGENFVSIKNLDGSIQVSVKDENGEHAVLGESLLEYLNELKNELDSLKESFNAHTHSGVSSGFSFTGSPFPTSGATFPTATIELLSNNVRLKKEPPGTIIPYQPKGAEPVSGSLEEEEDTDRQGNSISETERAAVIQKSYEETVAAGYGCRYRSTVFVEDLVDLIIVHGTAGGSAAGTVSYFSQPDVQVSSHYVIARDGTLHTVVPVELVANHAGKNSSFDGKANVNDRSVGVELANWQQMVRRNLTDPDSWPVVPVRGVDFEYRTYLNTVYTGPDPIYDEESGFWWEPYQDEQVNSLVAVVDSLIEHFPLISVSQIFGHSDVAPGYKVDPGPAFPWADFISRIGQGAGPAA